MKKYKETTPAKSITGYEARYMEIENIFVDTNLIVWIGSSKCWTKVFLSTADHSLYVKTGKNTYEAIETLNIRKTETI